jgi:hypothetical protein
MEKHDDGTEAGRKSAFEGHILGKAHIKRSPPPPPPLCMLRMSLLGPSAQGVTFSSQLLIIGWRNNSQPLSRSYGGGY